jgi:hypothetical protein
MTAWIRTIEETNSKFRIRGGFSFFFFLLSILSSWASFFFSILWYQKLGQTLQMASDSFATMQKKSFFSSHTQLLLMKKMNLPIRFNLECLMWFHIKYVRGYLLKLIRNFVFKKFSLSNLANLGHFFREKSLI